MEVLKPTYSYASKQPPSSRKVTNIYFTQQFPKRFRNEKISNKLHSFAKFYSYKSTKFSFKQVLIWDAQALSEFSKLDDIKLDQELAHGSAASATKLSQSPYNYFGTKLSSSLLFPLTACPLIQYSSIFTKVSYYLFLRINSGTSQCM
jgi:hypothetical protein